MRTFLGLAALVLVTQAAGPGSAALPPNVQRLNQLRAVLENPEVQAAFLPPDLIERIELVRPNLYRVTGGRCHVDVTIVHQPMPSRAPLGTPPFEARPGRRVCGE